MTQPTEYDRQAAIAERVINDRHQTLAWDGPRHEPTMPGYWCPRCREGMSGCDDRACVCSCQDEPASEVKP